MHDIDVPIQINMLFLPPTNEIIRVDSNSKQQQQQQQQIINNENENTININNNSNNNNKDTVAKTATSTTTTTTTSPSDWSSRFSNLFSQITKKKKSNYELEIDALKDAFLLNKPINNEEGILIYTLSKSKKYIHSLAELDIGYVYLTEKETPIIRQNEDEIILANKIIIQANTMKHFSIKGILQVEIATLAVETFTKRKLSQGHLLLEEDGLLCAIVYKMDQLITNTIYCNQDDTVMLQRLPGSEGIRFRFSGEYNKQQIQQAMIAFSQPSDPITWKRIIVLKEQQHHSTSSFSGDNIATRFLNRIQAKSKEELVELKAKRENTILKLKNRMKLDWEWKYTSASTEVPEPPTFIDTMVNRVKEKISSNNKLSDLLNSSKKSTQPSKIDSNPPSPFLDSVNKITAATVKNEIQIINKSGSESKVDDLIPNFNSLSLDPQPIYAAPPPPPPAPPAPPPPPPPPAMKLKRNTLNTPKKGGQLTPMQKKMRQLHWNAIPKEKLKETFWDNLSPVKGNENDQTLVESWFSLSPLSKDKSNSSNSSSGSNSLSSSSNSIEPIANIKVTLLDLRRSNNICILLSQFKLSYSAIKEAILSFDDNKLSVEQLIALDAMLPISEEEQLLLTSYSGDREHVGNAERFLLEMLSITHLPEKIQCYLFKLEIDSIMQQIQLNLETLSKAIEQLRNSKKFIKVLKVIFHIGSILNRGTYLNSTKGFKLDSLSKLSETKSKDQKHTVVDFIEIYIRENQPELLQFYAELDLVDKVAQLSLESLLEEVNDIDINFKKVQDEIIYHDSLPISPINKDTFNQVMEPFYDSTFTKFTQLKQFALSTQKQFQECCIYFGEDSNSISSKDFFNNIIKFTISFKNSNLKQSK